MTIAAGAMSYSVDFKFNLMDRTTKDFIAFKRSIVEAFPSLDVDDIPKALLGRLMKITASDQDPQCE